MMKTEDLPIRNMPYSEILNRFWGNEQLNEEELMILAENIDPMPVDAAKKGRIWQRIDNRINGDCPDGGTTITEKDSDWFDLDDHISIKVLNKSG